MPQRIIQDTYDVLVDERLTAGKGKPLDPEAERFVDIGTASSKRSNCKRLSPGFDPQGRKGRQDCRPCRYETKVRPMHAPGLHHAVLRSESSTNRWNGGPGPP